MPQPRHPELEGDTPQTLYSFELKRPGQTLKERLAAGLFGVALGLGEPRPFSCGLISATPGAAPNSGSSERPQRPQIPKPGDRG